MNESEFITELQKRAKEQELVIKAMPFPKVFGAASVWLGVHPWRFLIPLAFFISLMLRLIFGTSYVNFVLSILTIPLLRFLT